MENRIRTYGPIIPYEDLKSDVPNKNLLNPYIGIPWDGNRIDRLFPEIPIIDYKDLNGMTLEIHVNESDEAIVVNGVDTKTGNVICLFAKYKE